MRISVSDTPDELAEAAAEHLAGLLGSGARTFGIAGGSSPIATYRNLRERDLSWEQVTCWLPDERWVPAGDPESNALMARTELTDHVASRLLAPDTTLADPAESAANYHRLLTSQLENAPNVVLLGMGQDGHTASLFPGTRALDVAEPGYVANWVDAIDSWRLTATAPLLQAAAHLIFLVAGSAKAPVLRSILVNEEPLPARVVADGAADVTWLLDAAAARDL